MQNVDYSSTASSDEKSKGRERGNCVAAKKEEFVIGWEWFQMLKQSMETPRVPASWPMCLLQGLSATESDTPVQWATVDEMLWEIAVLRLQEEESLNCIPVKHPNLE